MRTLELPRDNVIVLNRSADLIIDHELMGIILGRGCLWFSCISEIRRGCATYKPSTRVNALVPRFTRRVLFVLDTQPLHLRDFILCDEKIEYIFLSFY